MKKCGELYEEKNLFEIDRVQRVMTAKETMHVSYCPFFSFILETGKKHIQPNSTQDRQ